jgi:glycosyltransferase involved in cell wall biosynthesis
MSTTSVIIPTYNHSKFIAAAIRSVLGQSVPVDEIIVVDDGSTDETRNVLEPYYDRISYIYQPNRGPAAARNRGMEEARGDFIAFLDSDDIWIRDKTKIQMEMFSRFPDLDIIFGDMANFSQDNHNSLPEIKNREIHDYFIAHSSNIERMFDCLITENMVPTPTVILKKACIVRVGFFDENLKIAEDFDYWLRATKCCSFGFVNAVLVKRRRHDSNLVNDWVKMNQAILEVLTAIARTSPEIPPTTLRILDQKIYRTHYDLGSFFLKAKNFQRACVHLKNRMPGKALNPKRTLKLGFAAIMKHILRNG